MAACEREFPKTYCAFEANSKSGGLPQKFWIQDATEDMFDEIIENKVTGFLKDEPVSSYMNGVSDDLSRQETRVMHRQILEENLSIVCLTKNDTGETKLAGFNLLYSSSPDGDNKGDLKVEGWYSNFVINLFTYLHKQRNVFEEFGVDKCLIAKGLYVLPDYRGKGLGLKLLKARLLLGKSMGFKVTTTVFTSIVSQKQAYKAGYLDYFCVDYEELCKMEPQFCIPDIQQHTKSVKVLYKQIE